MAASGREENATMGRGLLHSMPGPLQRAKIRVRGPEEAR